MDLNLLESLHALLEEGSVTAAAARIHITTPAMSRALGRLRDQLKDPLLVRAGQRMVPTPHALAIQPRVAAAVRDARAVLQPGRVVPVALLERTLVVRASDAVAGMLAPHLTRAAAAEAPHLTLRFVPEGDEDVDALRAGRVDLDVGAMDGNAPELCMQVLARDHFVAVVRTGHPLAQGRMTPARFVDHGHVVVSRHAIPAGPLERALQRAGLTRRCAVRVPSFYAALFVVAQTDLVATVPHLLARHAAPPMGLELVDVPFKLDATPVVQAWHPRFDLDPAHRWLRHTIKRAVATLLEPAAGAARTGRKR